MTYQHLLEKYEAALRDDPPIPPSAWPVRLAIYLALALFTVGCWGYVIWVLVR